MPGGTKNAKAAFDAAQSPNFYKNWPVCNCGAILSNGSLGRPHLRDCATTMTGFSKFVQGSPYAMNTQISRNLTGPGNYFS